MASIRSSLLLLVLMLAACAPAPQRAGIPTTWQGSPNFNDRKPNFVVIHHTSDDTADQALRTLSNPLRSVSAHYLIDRDGLIFQLVDERARAWHAGESKWGTHTDINSASLGIELDNNGREPFPEAQIAALLRLLTDIGERHRIPAANYLGHADVAPRRKTDPSRYFPWKTLAEHGFGLWCEPPFTAPPPAFDAMVALRGLGYDTANPEAALQAFKLRYLPQESAAELGDHGLGDLGLGDHGRGLLNCLYDKTGRAP